MVPRDLVKSRELFVAFPQKFSVFAGTSVALHGCGGMAASDEFGGFYNGVERKFGMKFVIEKK